MIEEPLYHTTPTVNLCTFQWDLMMKKPQAMPPSTPHSMRKEIVLIQFLKWVWSVKAQLNLERLSDIMDV